METQTMAVSVPTDFEFTSDETVLAAARHLASPLQQKQGDFHCKPLEVRLQDLRDLRELELAVALDGASRSIPCGDVLRRAVRNLSGLERIHLSAEVRRLRSQLEQRLTAIS